jgi:transposase
MTRALIEHVSYGGTVMEARDDISLLMAIAQQRDRAAFAELHERYQKRTFNQAFRILRDRTLAEDAVQESMLSVWHSAKTVQSDWNAEDWILRIVTNKSLQIERGRGRRAKREESIATERSRFIEAFDAEIDLFTGLAQRRLTHDAGYTAIQQIPGIGPVLAAVFVAEIGDVHRFDGPAKLTCWAGLTPRHHESDTTVHRGHITKQGSRLVRWAAIESVKILPAASRIGAIREQVAHRRGNRNIGAVAAARRQLELVFYGLRDHHVRALHRSPRAA